MRRSVKTVSHGVYWWYVIQILILELAPLIANLFSHHHVKWWAPVVNILITIISLLVVVEPRWDKQRWGHRFNLVNHYVVTTVQMLIPVQIGVLMALLSHWTHLPAKWITLVGTVYLLVMLVPVAMVVFAKIESVIGRIAMSALVVFVLLQGMSVGLYRAQPNNFFAFLKPWYNSGIIFAFMFAIFMVTTMHQWGYRGPSWRLARGLTALPIAWIVVTMVGYSFWNGFAEPNKLSNLFTRYNFHLARPDLTTILTGFEAGIAEEWLWRFAVLTLLLVWVQKKHISWTWMAWLDGLLFGLWHFTNLSGQTASATVNQMISAASAGALFAAIYLYTKAIWVPMIFHAAVDSLSFMVSGNITASSPDLIDWVTTGIQLMIFAALTLYLLSGKRKSTIESNWQLK